MKVHPYILIYNELKEEIQKGLYKEGAYIPSENELCSRFKCSRMTIRHALKLLIQEGFICSIQGKGNIVKTQIRRLGLLNFKGFSEVVEGAKTNLLQKPSLSAWPSPFFYPLSHETIKNGCIILQRLRLKEIEPLMLEITFLPTQFQKIIEAPLLDGSLFKSLKHWFGLEVLHLDQSISAVTSDHKVSLAMGIREGTPLVYIERKYITNDAAIEIYSALYCNTGKFALHSEL